MPRTVKEYDERYSQFLDIAQRLFYQKGYEQTSIQEIIHAMGVAKGLFYYYFRSKTDLLDALVERSVEQTLQTLAPMVSDESLSAPEKFVRIFGDVNNWKLANKAFLLEAMRVLYRDENVLLRFKMTAASKAKVVPLLTGIISQGIDEGVFDVSFPQETADIVMEMSHALSSALVEMLLHDQGGAEVRPNVEHRLQAYQQGIERVLNASAGSLPVIQIEQLMQWFEG